MLDTLLKYRRWIGAAAILLCIWAWSVDLLGWTYVCPFCRVQRTVIGLLGLLMLFPVYGHWFARYVSAILGAFGIVVASTQHFGGWRRLSAGEFKLQAPIYYDSFLLSGVALCIIVALVLLIWTPSRQR
ncbi:MAG: hypothetical protein AAF311_12560 [Pseudomonadota bacterium]